MTTQVDFHFLNPEWLLAIPVVWLLIAFFAVRYRQSAMWEKVCDPILLKHMRTGNPKNRFSRPLVSILMVVTTLTLIAIAGPSWRSNPQALFESGKARVIALDLSQQMLVQDIKPNRFSRALDAIRAIITSGFDGETGLIVYSGTSFIVSPLSKDAQSLLAFIDQLNPEIMPIDGDRIDNAIDTAQQLLEASVAKRGEIYIITAGTDAIDAAMNASIRAAQSGSQVSVLAVGSEAGGPRVDINGNLVRDSAGQYLLSRTRFEQLQRISQVSGGQFLQIKEATIPASFFASQLQIKEGQSKESRREEGVEQIPVNDGIWIVWLLIPFSLLLFRRNLLWILMLVLMLPDHNGLYAAETENVWQHSEKRAYQAYQNQDYSRAAELSENPMLVGAAHYRAGNFDQAIRIFKSIDTAESFFNQGNAYAQLGQFPEAIQAFDHALERSPAYLDAAFNRELIAIYLRQQNSNEEASSDGEEASLNSEDSEQSSAQAQLGSMGTEQSNPADEQQPGSGIGASSQLSLLEDSERFSGREEQTETIPGGLRPDEVLPDKSLIEGWIRSLPQASSELFRRKFLRDYERQNIQQR
ncbi:MAG: VWA domain-containing protein [Pseudomonadota bacterium]